MACTTVAQAAGSAAGSITMTDIVRNRGLAITTAMIARRPRTARLGAALLTVACAVCIGGNAHATPIEGSIFVYSQAGVTGYTPMQSTQTQNWYAPASSPLSMSSSATEASGAATANAYMNGSATWAPDGDSGTFSFNYGISGTSAPYIYEEVNNIPFGGNPLNLYGSVGTPPNWGYEFTADATGDFVLNYTINTTRDTFPLQGFSISGLPGDVNFGTGIDASGAFIVPLVQGQTYTIWIEEQSNEKGKLIRLGPPRPPSAGRCQVR
jgi:hypothetical protein